MDFTTLFNWATIHRDVLIGIFWGAIGLSITLEMLLTKFRIQSKKIAFTLLHVFSAMSGLATFVLGVSGEQAIGTYAGLALVAGFWHRFVVSDANTKYVTPFLKWLASQNIASSKAVSPSNMVDPSTTATAPFRLPQEGK